QEWLMPVGAAVASAGPNRPAQQAPRPILRPDAACIMLPADLLSLLTGAPAGSTGQTGQTGTGAAVDGAGFLSALGAALGAGGAASGLAPNVGGARARALAGETETAGAEPALLAGAAMFLAPAPTPAPAVPTAPSTPPASPVPAAGPAAAEAPAPGVAAKSQTASEAAPVEPPAAG